tara:strand:- start:15251 stop:15886 length:636 start_codon:yes stop_codon:yes gene_type:complete
LKEFPKVHQGWLKRFDRLYEIMENDLVYMDVIRRKRSDIGDDSLLEIRINDKPYPEVPAKALVDHQMGDNYRRDVLEWMGSSVELCVVSTINPGSKTFIDIWEPCGFATMMTVAGREVMVSTRHRLAASVELSKLEFAAEMSHHFTDSLAARGIDETNNIGGKQVYVEFSKLLSRGRNAFEVVDDPPPIREKTFREDHEKFIEQMEADELW